MQISSTERSAGQLSKASLATAVRTFRDVGMVVLENALDLKFVAVLRDAEIKARERYIASKGGLKALEGKTFGKNHVGFFPPLLPPFSDPQVVANPFAVQIMTELLGGDLQCSFYNDNVAYPGSGTQPLHRDTRPLFHGELNVPTPTVQLVLNIPLCDFTEENGSTEIWPGTHLIVDVVPEDEGRLEERAKELPSIRANLSAGSLVLRDLRLWHRGMPNHADYARSMFALVYQRGWLTTKPMNLPKSTWDAWPEAARKIFRNNPVVEDELYNSTGHFE